MSEVQVGKLEVMVAQLTEDVQEVKRLVKDNAIINNIQNEKIASHDAYLKLLGSAIVIMIPILVGWSYHYVQTIRELQTTAIILQERLRVYDNSTATQNNHCPNWDTWEIIPREETPSIFTGTPVEGQLTKPILYPNRKVSM